jgi:hypothetical protein
MSLATIAIAWGHPHQSGDLFTVQGDQFWQPGHKALGGQRTQARTLCSNWSFSTYTGLRWIKSSKSCCSSWSCFWSEWRCTWKAFADLSRESSAQARPVGGTGSSGQITPAVGPPARGAAAVAAAEQNGPEPDTDLISFGQLVGRAGKFPHLARVNDLGRQVCLPERGRGQSFKPTAGFQQDQLGFQRHQTVHQNGDARVILATWKKSFPGLVATLSAF